MSGDGNALAFFDGLQLCLGMPWLDTKLLAVGFSVEQSAPTPLTARVFAPLDIVS